MICVTLYEVDGETRAVVHDSDGTPGGQVDVTDDYEIKPMVLEEGSEIIYGWHVGKRVPRASVVLEG